MKILMVLSRIPYPLDKGDKLRAYHQIKELIASGQTLIIVCIHFEKAEHLHLQHLRNLGGQWHFVKLSPITAFLNIALNVFSQQPFQVALFYQRKAYRYLSAIIQSEKPDHLIAQLIRTTEYIKTHVSIPKSLDYMDALGDGLKRRAERSPWVTRWIWKEESDRLLRYESIIWNYFDFHFIISRKDAQKVLSPQPEKWKMLPNGIDTAFFSNPHDTPSTYLLFTGNMAYPPNVDAAIYLVQEIMPLVWKARPDMKVMIAGADPTASVLQLTSEKTVVTGRLEDIRSAYAQAQLFIAPMRMGSGMQNKILEALSMEIPVITTSVAAEAFSSTVQSTLHIGNDAAEIAQLIIQQFANPFPPTSIARDLVVKEYNWQNTIAQFLNVIDEKH